MQALDQIRREVLQDAVAVFTDIDDTITVAGRLPSVAYQALEQLRQVGLLVIPVTGRPAGWCDLIARQWPVDAVVGENGAFWFRYDEHGRRMIRQFMRPESQRCQDRAKLDEIAQRVLSEVPGTALASDQDYRAVDVAIDFAEDVTPLPPPAVDKIVAMFEAGGAMAKVSSIHVNAWYGDHDKLATSLVLLRDAFGIDGDAQRSRIIFAGDSPNDAQMFGFFPNSVGVANVLEFAGRISTLPGYVTTKPAAHGFAELADRLVQARGMKTRSRLS